MAKTGLINLLEVFPDRALGCLASGACDFFAQAINYGNGTLGISTGSGAFTLPWGNSTAQCFDSVAGTETYSDGLGAPHMIGYNNTGGNHCVGTVYSCLTDTVGNVVNGTVRIGADLVPVIWDAAAQVMYCGPSNGGDPLDPDEPPVEPGAPGGGLSGGAIAGIVVGSAATVAGVVGAGFAIKAYTAGSTAAAGVDRPDLTLSSSSSSSSYSSQQEEVLEEDQQHSWLGYGQRVVSTIFPVKQAARGAYTLATNPRQAFENYKQSCHNAGYNAGYWSTKAYNALSGRSSHREALSSSRSSEGELTV